MIRGSALLYHCLSWKGFASPDRSSKPSAQPDEHVFPVRGASRLELTTCGGSTGGFGSSLCGADRQYFCQVVKTMSYSNPAELRKRLAGLLISAPN